MPREAKLKAVHHAALAYFKQCVVHMCKLLMIFQELFPTYDGMFLVSVVAAGHGVPPVA